MAVKEKFRLTWNDFERNVSSAFNAIWEDKDFLDVTLVCDNKQVEAHKVVIAACSPFFKSILRRNPHQHPLLYLKGVLFDDLVSVLHFMYKGEVNIAQEQLNSFLSVAEDLQVKGLTYYGHNGVNSKPEASPKSSSRPFHPAPAISSTNQIKRQKVTPSTSTSQSFVDTGDDVIQEVVPVKTEPSQHQQVNPHQSQEVLAPMEDQNYVEEGYEDYAEDQQNEDGTELPKDVDSAVKAKMRKEGRLWLCTDCDYSSYNFSHIYDHIERKHAVHSGYDCQNCGQVLKTKDSARRHSKNCLP